jgi:hypothetical protein
MFASPFRKAPRHRLPTREYLELEQEFRRRPRPRSERWLLPVVIGLPVLLFAAIELGRCLWFLQDVKTFSATLDQRPPAGVKRDLHRYAEHLGDRNPVVRNAALAALKLGTGWNAGSSPSDWHQMWTEQEPYWEYRHVKTNAPAADWRSQLPATP